MNEDFEQVMGDTMFVASLVADLIKVRITGDDIQLFCRHGTQGSHYLDSRKHLHERLFSCPGHDLPARLEHRVSREPEIQQLFG